MANIKINEGTATTIKTDTVSGAEYQVVKLDVGAAGASSLFTGTIKDVTNIANLTKGTVTALATGTITGGTLGNLNFGTVDTFYRHPDAFATIVSNTGTALGTVKAAVNGSAHYITDMTISAQTAAQCALYAGSTLVRAGTYYFADTGGMVNNLNTPIVIAAGSEITFRTIGTGLVTLELRGYVD